MNGERTLLNSFGTATITQCNAFPTGITMFDELGLSLPKLIILGMGVGSAARQTYWLQALKGEQTLSTVFSSYTVEAVCSTAGSLLFLCAATSSAVGPTFYSTTLPQSMVAGSVLYIVGIILEAVSEYQRKKCRDIDPASQDEPVCTGLWSWARHINHGGWVLWRAGWLLAVGRLTGLTCGAVLAADTVLRVVLRVVPMLDMYCLGSFGDRWISYKKEVEWTVLPGVY